MRPLRILLLLLLAVLLPARGALASAMLCAPAGAGTHSEAAAMDHHAAGNHEQHDDHDAAAPADASPSNAHDECNLCSAYCTATTLPSSAPAAPAPQAVATARFPALCAPAPSFLSGGQERPPRIS